MRDTDKTLKEILEKIRGTSDWQKMNWNPPENSGKSGGDMKLIIHDMEGGTEIGSTFKNPNFRGKAGKLHTFDRVVANPMSTEV